MKRSRVIFCLLMSLCVALSAAGAEQPPAKALTAKEVEKLVAEGDALCKGGQLEEALFVYRQAAKTGHIKAVFGTGNVLIQQAKDKSGRERLLKLSEGLANLYTAATNRHPAACAGLSGVYQNGTGVGTNLVESYAWMTLAAKLDKVFKADLDRLVAGLTPQEVRKAQLIAREYELGHWPPSPARPIALGDARFKIQGVSSGGRAPLAIVNSTTLAIGDAVDIFPTNSPKANPANKRKITCLEIGPDYVLLAVAGEPNLKLIPTDHLK